MLAYSLNLQSVSQEGQQGLCCGRSLANIKINNTDRKKITSEAISLLTENNPDLLVTGCPLCKKTFGQLSPIPVLDISEVVSMSMVQKKYYVETDEGYQSTKHVEKFAEVQA